jgi:hypothetical protein
MRAQARNHAQRKVNSMEHAGVALCVAPALQELAGKGEGVTEVLPALKNLFIERRQPLPPVQEATWKFLVARELSGHPVVVRCWVRESKSECVRRLFPFLTSWDEGIGSTIVNTFNPME